MIEYGDGHGKVVIKSYKRLSDNKIVQAVRLSRPVPQLSNISDMNRDGRDDFGTGMTWIVHWPKNNFTLSCAQSYTGCYQLFGHPKDYIIKENAEPSETNYFYFRFTLCKESDFKKLFVDIGE